MKILLLILILLPNICESGVSILHIYPNAGTGGMNNTGIAVAHNSSFILINPAGIGELKKNELNLAYSFWPGITSWEYLSFAFSTGKFASIGMGMIYSGIDPFPRRDLDGNIMKEDIDGYDLLVFGSYARRISSIPVGINLKFLRSRLYNRTASTFALDFGGLYYWKRLQLGVSIRNLGLPLKYIDVNAPLPIFIGVGAGYTILNNKLLLALDTGYKDNNIFISSGAEFKVYDYIIIRTGYQLNGDLTIGGGLNYQNNRYEYRLNYSLILKNDIGNINKFSFLIVF